MTEQATPPVAATPETDGAVARRRLGGRFTRPRRTAAGLRPTSVFAIAALLTAVWVGFAVWVSAPWRDQLEQALGPVMAWVIPIFLAYIPGLVIGFMVFTLLINPYRELSLAPPAGGWPAVTIVVAAWNEEEAIVPTLQRLADLSYAGPVEVVLADNASTDQTAPLAEEAAHALRLDYRRVLETTPGKHAALNAALKTVTTPIVVDRRRGHLPAARVAVVPDRQAVERATGAACLRVRRRARRAESALALRHADAAVGLPARHQRREAHAGVLQHRPRGARGVLGLLGRRRARGGRLAPDAIGEDIVSSATCSSTRC